MSDEVIPLNNSIRMDMSLVRGDEEFPIKMEWWDRMGNRRGESPGAIICLSLEDAKKLRKMLKGAIKGIEEGRHKR